MLHRKFAYVIALALCLQLLLPAFSSLAIVEPYDLNRLAAESNSIVWGQVLNVAPHRTIDGGQIYSTVTVAVRSYLKGAGEAEVQFEIPGGDVNGIVQETEDAPEFGVGQETIVFLCAREQPVTGWDQGKFTVVDRRVVEANWMPVADFLLQLRDALAKQGHAMPDVVFEEPAEDAVSPMAVPSITSVSPTSASAGTDTQVTINGTNFGATRGSSTVKFYHGSTWTSVATYDSWSNTQVKVRVPTPASSHTTQGIKLTTTGGSGYAAFTITFAYRGAKWPGSPSEAVYYVYSNTSDCTGEASDIREGAWAWNEVDYHHHSLKYWGSTTRTAPTEDDYNVLRWGSTGGSIATCTTWSSGTTIVEFDIEFEDTGYTWNTDSTCPAGEMDVWNIAIHELGHGAVGLKDLYGSPDSDKTMYGYAANGETKKRSLDAQDTAAIKWIY